MRETAQLGNGDLDHRALLTLARHEERVAVRLRLDVPGLSLPALTGEFAHVAERPRHNQASHHLPLREIEPTFPPRSIPGRRS